jgi:dihydroorotase
MKILIRGGRLIDPKNDLDGKFDVLISNNIIERVDKNIRAATDTTEVINATGHIISPGFIDVHAHLREPGYEYKETIKTGTMAAAKGGFTTVTSMANTSPVNDNKSVTEFIREKAR